ncbi:hypothetical protein [Geobacillus subterraneus]|uniref:Xylose isomerase-like TIM barrel domain-containing protein n=1 Tax=Geobacillus subterraneus TaxID=129338 RepID=A0A679FRV7_9BACL|nr:hypothetical protein [Geobacillus subterraneus]BBW98883.1 hypothetical protein GsuE55_37160 [Geobacillus subterraneus]
MLVGQMGYQARSCWADYVQLDVCGKSVTDVCQQWEVHPCERVILHGDWTKRGASENDIGKRWREYVEMILALKAKTHVLGITIHPPSRRQWPLSSFLEICGWIEREACVPVFVENRSDSSRWFSSVEEILKGLEFVRMTIDLPQLWISCRYDNSLFLSVCERLQRAPIGELHVANAKRINGRTYVGRKLNDGEIWLEEALQRLSHVPLGTLEILGGAATFESEQRQLQSILGGA